DGENAERAKLGGRFATLVGNFRQIMSAQKRLTWFTSTFTQISIVFPFVVVSPAYFAGTIPLGVLVQTGTAFGQVQSAFSFFVRVYATIAEWRSVVERLSGFEHSIVEANRLKDAARIQFADAAKGAVMTEKLALELPSGVPLVTADNLDIA